MLGSQDVRNHSSKCWIEKAHDAYGVNRSVVFPGGLEENEKEEVGCWLRVTNAQVSAASCMQADRGNERAKVLRIKRLRSSEYSTKGN